MGVGAGLYMCDVVKKVHVRYLISWWVLVVIVTHSHMHRDARGLRSAWSRQENISKITRRPCCRGEPPRDAGHLYRKLAPNTRRKQERHAFSNPEFGDDGARPRACISAWEYYRVYTLLNPLNTFLQHEFWYFSQNTTHNVFADTDTTHAPYHVTYAYGGRSNIPHVFEIADPDFLLTEQFVSLYD